MGRMQPKKHIRPVVTEQRQRPKSPPASDSEDSGPPVLQRQDILAFVRPRRSRKHANRGRDRQPPRVQAEATNIVVENVERVDVATSPQPGSSGPHSVSSSPSEPSYEFPMKKQKTKKITLDDSEDSDGSGSPKDNAVESDDSTSSVKEVAGTLNPTADEQKDEGVAGLDDNGSKAKKNAMKKKKKKNKQKKAVAECTSAPERATQNVVEVVVIDSDEESSSSAELEKILNKKDDPPVAASSAPSGKQRCYSPDITTLGVAPPKKIPVSGRPNLPPSTSAATSSFAARNGDKAAGSRKKSPQPGSSRTMETNLTDQVERTRVLSSLIDLNMDNSGSDKDEEEMNENTSVSLTTMTLHRLEDFPAIREFMGEKGSKIIDDVLNPGSEYEDLEKLQKELESVYSSLQKHKKMLISEIETLNEENDGANRRCSDYDFENFLKGKESFTQVEDKRSPSKPTRSLPFLKNLDDIILKGSANTPKPVTDTNGQSGSATTAPRNNQPKKRSEVVKPTSMKLRQRSKVSGRGRPPTKPKPKPVKKAKRKFNLIDTSELPGDEDDDLPTRFWKFTDEHFRSIEQSDIDRLDALIREHSNMIPPEYLEDPIQIKRGPNSEPNSDAKPGTSSGIGVVTRGRAEKEKQKTAEPKPSTSAAAACAINDEDEELYSFEDASYEEMERLAEINPLEGSVARSLGLNGNEAHADMRREMDALMAEPWPQDNIAKKNGKGGRGERGRRFTPEEDEALCREIRRRQAALRKLHNHNARTLQDLREVAQWDMKLIPAMQDAQNADIEMETIRRLFYSTGTRNKETTEEERKRIIDAEIARILHWKKVDYLRDAAKAELGVEIDFGGRCEPFSAFVAASIARVEAEHNLYLQRNHANTKGAGANAEEQQQKEGRRVSQRATKPTQRYIQSSSP